MENCYVNGKDLIGDIIDRYPATAEVLFNIGMHCIGCPASQAETLEDACAVHGIDVASAMNAINARIAESE